MYNSFILHWETWDWKNYSHDLVKHHVVIWRQGFLTHSFGGPQLISQVWIGRSDVKGTVILSSGFHSLTNGQPGRNRANQDLELSHLNVPPGSRPTRRRSAVQPQVRPPIESSLGYLSSLPLSQAEEITPPPAHIYLRPFVSENVKKTSANFSWLVSCSCWKTTCDLQFPPWPS